jgi:hypothetical protein
MLVQNRVAKKAKREWESQFDDPERLRPRDHQAFAVLTLCRELYTLQRGTISSKPQATAWTQEAYINTGRDAQEKKFV